MTWLDAVRDLAATRVAQRRAAWQQRGGIPSVHDAIDDVLAARSAPEPAQLAAARDAIANDDRWRRIGSRLDVPPREQEWLALLAACELDPPLTRVLGYLDDSSAPAMPSPAVAALMWGWPLGYQPGPASATVRWHLAAPDAAAGWHSSSPWTIDADIAAFLVGFDGWIDYRGFLVLPDLDDLECMHPALVEEMAAAAGAVAADGRSGCEVELVGAAGSGRRTLLSQLAVRLGHRPALLEPSGGVHALRAARLLDALPVWAAATDDLVGVDVTPGALTFVARNSPSSSHPHGVVRLSWSLPAPQRSERRRLWASHTDQVAPRMVDDWALMPGDIRTGAAATAAGPALAADVMRRRLRSGALESMTEMQRPYDWDDLVLADRVALQLRRLRAQVLLTRDVLDDWEFRRLCPTTAGVTALFAGPSGTGKTMAAQVLARSLDLDLYRVDLAEVVNKYIGETEKRLAQVFEECERTNVMVLFDEADALFGQRTQVRDAHDRYANIEIDYLLQRLDTFRGVAILATNRKSDLDPAFTRRLRVIVDFLEPSPSERLRIWHLALRDHTADGAPITDGVDREALAEALELTGAEIKAVVLAAAFDARETGHLITTDHLLEAASRELVKRGSVLRPSSLVAAMA
jgi:AAA+ superfamily predicted ATPase